ncbi:hypothetical protein CQ018_09625 [Arthrobacter sp. MYb227]|uniref:hypothetical protein n=1 Tax=Arthrobacter sp. MYb227 TaxID=1848601 RepID=UPI000CFCEE04|nr:hypothetical protein [Arthrobacter sp. MYb227]PQZ93888.1 hypothetical protein CQ018_09625 [Arthrobacter sp. MYb227]
MRNTRIISTVLAPGIMTLVFLLGGCASETSANENNVRAHIDSATGEIVLPLEAYAMNQKDERDVGQANALLLNKCLKETGRNFPRATQDWAAIPAYPDRRYGLWSKADAVANGYELPEAKDAKSLTEQEETLGQDWWSAYEVCHSDLQLFPMMGINTAMDPSPVDLGMQESFEALLASSEFERIRDEWKLCVTAAGLTPDPNSTLMVPAIPAWGEDQLRVAAADVECKESLNSVQPLADFEASEQKTYIKKHESELTNYRNEVDKVLESVTKTITTHGG